MQRVKYDSSIILLMRFDGSATRLNSVLPNDTPYIHTSSDEVSSETWTAYFTAALQGQQRRNNIPFCFGPSYNLINDFPGYLRNYLADTIDEAYTFLPFVNRTPKFGYCSGHIDSYRYFSCTNSSGVWSFTGGEKELELWVRGAPEDEGNTGIFLRYKNTGGNDILTFARTSESGLTISGGGKSLTASGLFPAEEWVHVRIQAKGDEFTIWLNGTACTDGKLNSTYEPSVIEFGREMSAEIDEIVVRDKLTDRELCRTVPTIPYLGKADIHTFGGFGSRGLGSVIVRQDCRINSYAVITGASGTKIETGGWTSGLFGGINEGDEVMLRVGNIKHESSYEYPKQYTSQSIYALVSQPTECGKYAFRKIQEIKGDSVILDSPVTEEFNLEGCLGTYCIQLISIPHFGDFTLEEGATVTPLKLNEALETESGGGIVAFRTRGDCTIKGKILTSGYGAPRQDIIQMNNMRLPDRFIINSGGGVFVTCGGTFTASHDARIGAEWDGAAGQGQGGTLTGRAPSGGAGWGGASCGFSNSTLTIYGLKSPGRAGAQGIANQFFPNDLTGGHTSLYSLRQIGWLNYNPLECDHGGITPGGDDGYDQTTPSTRPSSAHNYIWWKDVTSCGGASIILLCRTLNADKSALSTGGQGGMPSPFPIRYDNNSPKEYTIGGGGAGFCYIACREMI